MQIALLSVASSLPYFVAWAMPDVFTGLGVLAITLLMVSSDRLSHLEWLLTWMVLTAATSFHFSNVITFIVVTAIAALIVNTLQLANRRRNFTALAWTAGALLIGASSGPIYRQIERDLFRHPINAPPLMRKAAALSYFPALFCLFSSLILLVFEA
jgi:hypothetical protein